MGLFKNKRKKRASTVRFVKPKKGLFGRKIYVHNAEEQAKTEKRVNLISRLIMFIVVIGGAVVAMVFLFGYLIPFLQTEFSTGEAVSSQSSESSVYIEPAPSYDTHGVRIYDNKFYLKTINASSPEDKDYTPKTKLVEGIEVHEDMAEGLEVLLEAVKEGGYVLELELGYVSYEKQDELYEQKVTDLMDGQGFTNVMARTEAKKFVPVAGESDFQTGLCIKLKYDADSFTSSATYSWMVRNLNSYGFVFRYPEGPSNKEVNEYTQMMGDLLVIRYVGVENAEFMRQTSMCLEQYVSYLKNQGQL